MIEHKKQIYLKIEGIKVNTQRFRPLMEKLEELINDHVLASSTSDPVEKYVNFEM
jgi:hypothetical protein